MRTLSDIIKEAKEIHGNKYDYSKAVYTKLIEPIEIICPIHGSFMQSPHSHLKGSGCPECAKIERANKKRDDKESFIEKARKTHGDKYSYDKVEYVDSKTKVCITCKKHGDFWQAPYLHILKNGCPKCKSESISLFHKSNTDEFIEKANKVHNGKYDYSKVEYIDSNTKVCIICPEHGEFYQTPSNHLMGKGCNKCSFENKPTKSTEKFIKDAIKVHGNLYDYTKTIYNNVFSPVIITCKTHGDFEQKPREHLSGCGCQKCFSSRSKMENDLLDFIKSVVDCEIIENDRSLLNGDELDIYIPSKNIAFEFDGLYWHSEANGKNQSYHINKTKKCEELGVQLIHLFEDEWIYKKDICKSRIKSLLGKSDEKIFARKCKIKSVDSKTEKKFLNDNHIQGYVASKYCLGLFYDDELVSLMSFTGLRKNLGSSGVSGSFELLRFCNRLNSNVIGAASRLFKHFVNDFNPDCIISYADRRWSIGNLYEKIGFEMSHVSKPSYFYVIGDKRKNRFGFRKDILISKYGCTKEETEHSFCLKNKWYRIYDCGTKVYKWKR